MISQTDAALTVAAAAAATNNTTTTTSLNTNLSNPAQQQTRSNDDIDMNLTDITSPQSRSNIINNNNNNKDQTSSITLNGKSSKVSGNNVTKKRKRFDETIIDGYAIIAFKTWEDLQDELNERNSITNSSTNNNNNNNNSIVNNNNNGGGTNFNTSNKCTTDATSTNKKASSKSKSKSSTNLLNDKSSDASSLSSASTIATTHASVTNSTTAGHKEVTSSSNSGKKKDKAKKNANQSTLDKATNQLTTKDKRNKTSSEKNTLKRALEAEKQVSILQEKLEQEQSRNRNLNHNKSTSINATKNVLPEHYASKQTTPNQINSPKDVDQQQNQHNLHHSSRANGMLGQVPLKEPNQAPKPMPYSPFHINSHIHHRQDTAAIQQIQIHHPPLAPSSPPRIHQQSTLHHQQAAQQTQHQHPMKNSPHLIHQHQSTPPPPPPPLMHQQPPLAAQLPQPQQPPIPNQQHPPHLLHQTPPPPPPHSTLNPSHHYYTHKQQPQLTTPHPHTHLMQQHQSSAQNPFNLYPHQPPSSIMSSMGLPALYNCPPSIYITDTISRQTSIIPPQSLGPALEQSNPQAPGNRFNHSSALHSNTSYTPPVPAPHHPMYYPSLPTERSFIEFARTYTGPGHLGYSNLMNTFPTSSTSTTANPYSFNSWPRLIDQRAVSRYNSLYQSTTILPERTYTNYSNTRAPSFPAGLFPPPF